MKPFSARLSFSTQRMISPEGNAHAARGGSPAVADDDPGARVAEALGALSSSTRLALLRELRTPKTLSEIELIPHSGPGAGRPLARQTVARLLESLAEAGLVEARATTRVHGPTTEYVVNHQQIFALGEELRMLARLRPSVEPGGFTAHADRPGPLPERGPLLVLVHGLDEGTAFPLVAPMGARAASWTIGRRRGVDIVLDFDPSVSSENSIVDLADGEHWIRDVEGSRNGTTLNLRRLRPQERCPLKHGDILGVGRTFLVYWA